MTRYFISIISREMVSENVDFSRGISSLSTGVLQVMEPELIGVPLMTRSNSRVRLRTVGS